jgi:hypothetical protein
MKVGRCRPIFARSTGFDGRKPDLMIRCVIDCGDRRLVAPERVETGNFLTQPLEKRVRRFWIIPANEAS